MPPIILTESEKTAIQNLHQNFNSEIKFIADRTYLQPMQRTANSEDENNFANRQFKEILDGKAFTKPQRTTELVRGIHGLRHATRVAIYTDMLHRFRSTKIVGPDGTLDKFPGTAINRVAKFFNITPEDVLMLTKFAAFFHDSAREDEATDKWDHRSAENCYDFLVHQGVNTEVARFFANAARYKSDYEKFNAYLSESLDIKTESAQNHFGYIRQLIASADTLDIMRCYPEVNGYYLDKFFRVKNSPNNREAANQLMLAVQRLLAAEGDLPSKSEIVISDKPLITLPVLKQGDIKPEWDENTKLAFEFSEDPWGYMQNYINNYIDQNKLQALPKTEPLSAASLNIPNKSLITECDWQELFATNDQFMFVKPEHSLDQIGHIATKQEPSKSIINIKKDSIEFSRVTDTDSLSEEQLLATIEILKGLIAQGKHDENNPLIMEPNHAFTVKMLADLNQHITANKIPVSLERREFINEQNLAATHPAKNQRLK